MKERSLTIQIIWFCTSTLQRCWLASRGFGREPKREGKGKNVRDIILILGFSCLAYNLSCSSYLSVASQIQRHHPMVIYIRLQRWAGDPLSMPLVLIGTAMAGILIAVFLITSALHWTNAYDMQKFPILMTELYDAAGNKYGISKVLNGDRLISNAIPYKEYSVTRLTSFRIASHALLFTVISTGLVQVLTKYGRYY
ncbi:hypothetical protein RHSIM_Rhsim03G0019900 [Rhododendron simsii]|uniref:Uncharacterized protein n=1 Tax=Rhododendron simsii TaxID=118357 RepID=A0A834H6U0_RHOSS|nr:hypothetical protein RHSIM_Rhsim03G0019900 [Rhododendron simsii]